MHFTGRALILTMFLANLAIGLSILTGQGTLGKGSFAWAAVFAPRILMATPYFLVAITALMGFRDLVWIRRSLYSGGMLMYIWGILLLAIWSDTGEPQPGFFFLVHVGILKHILAELVPQVSLINQIKQVAENAGHGGS